MIRGGGVLGAAQPLAAKASTPARASAPAAIGSLVEVEPLLDTDSGDDDEYS